MLPSSAESVEAYVALRTRMIATLEVLDHDELARPVPACPAWTVTELVAHLAGNAHDVATDNIEGAASDPWTEAQVQRGKDRSVADLLEDWRRDGAEVDRLLREAPERRAAQLVFDTATHEQDLYSALGRRGERESAEVVVALGFMLHTLDGLVRGMDLPPLEILTGERTSTLGEGEAVTRLVGTPYDMLRALGGRRTRAEVDALVERGDLEPYLFVFGPGSPLRLPGTSLGE